MEQTARIHRRDLEFTDGVATVRLHGRPALAARELDEIWLPLLMTGHQDVIVLLDELDRLDAEVIAALGRVLTHARSQSGEMALVTARPEFVEALREWHVDPAIPVLLDVDSATAFYRERDVSAPIGEHPVTSSGEVSG
jgi:anti-anti-sigma regulatory factor